MKSEIVAEPAPPPIGESPSRGKGSLIQRVRSSVFARAVAGTAGANVAATFLTSVGGILLARELGPSLRGDLAVVVVWPTFTGLVALLGLPQAACYLISKTPKSAPDVVASVSVGCAVLSLAIGVAGVLISPLVGSRPEIVRDLRILFILLPLYTTPVAWIAALQALKIGYWNVARLIQPAVYFAGIVGLVVANRLSIGGTVVTLIASLALQAVVGGALVLRVVGRPGRVRWDLWTQLWSYGIRTAASIGPYLVNYRLDQLVLSLMVTAAALGNYAVAVSISVLATPVAFAFGYVAFPKIAAAASEAETRRVERVAIVGAFLVGSAVLVPLAALARWYVPLVFGPGYDRAVTALWLLVPGTIAFAVNQVVEDILRGRGKPLAPAVAEGVGAALTVSLLLVLVPRFGIYGAAGTSVVVYTTVGLILTRMLRQARRSSGSDLPSLPGETLPEIERSTGGEG